MERHDDVRVSKGRRLNESEIEGIDSAFRESDRQLVDLRNKAFRQPRAASGVGDYVSELGARGQLTEPETDRLALRAKSGDPEAREQLLENLLPSIAAVSRKYKVPGLEFTDLIQEGCVGVLRALERYEPAAGTPFWAYASWWVRHALQELRSDFLRPTRIPPKALAQLSHLKTSHNRYYMREGHEPDLEALVEESELAAEQIDALLRADRRPKSLDEPVRDRDGEIGSVGDLLDDPLSAEAYEDVIDSLAGKQIRALFSRLSERESEIVGARFGLDDRDQESLTEIGERLGISAERVRQLEETGLAKLRHTAV